MSWAKYVVKPLPVFDGQVPIRKELNALSNEEKFLYLEGMRRFQGLPVDDPLSYYQIAGIHGLPYTTWPVFKDPATGENFDTGTNEVTKDGFCTHSSVLFLSWHRPYLVLFESALYKHVNDVANNVDGANKGTYQKLARNFRIPYWDWAKKNVDHFPIIALSKTAALAFSPDFKPPTVAETGSGKVDKDGNPETEPQQYDSTQRYVQYKKQSNPDDVVPNILKFFLDRDFGWKREPGTNGPDDEGERFTGDEIPVGSRPRERNLSERTAYLLKSYQRYGPMSYNAVPQFPGDIPADAPNVKRAEVWGSLEDIHNAVHDYVGGGGHMGSVPTSAFDPIFWLHHTNIDRLFTIWQALHENDGPTAYVEEKPVPGSTFAKGPDFDSFPKWPEWRLLVLLEGQGDAPWWNSVDSRRTEPFGYSYEETLGWKYPGTPADRARLIKKIDTMYINLPAIAKQSVRKVANAGEEILPQAALLKSLAVEKEQVSISAEGAEPVSQIKLMQQVDAKLPPAETLLESYSGPDQPYFRDLLAKDSSYREWLVNVKIKKHAKGGKAVVHFFLGDPPPAGLAKLWPYTPYHVGAFVALGQDTDTACENCRQAQADGLEITGQIPLTIALAERYVNKTIPDLEETTVENYLRENMRWRTVLNNGSVVENQSEVEGLLVYVVSNKVTISADEDVPPVYDDEVRIHPAATTRPNVEDEGRGSGTGLTIQAFSHVPSEWVPLNDV